MLQSKMEVMEFSAHEQALDSPNDRQSTHGRPQGSELELLLEIAGETKMLNRRKTERGYFLNLRRNADLGRLIFAYCTFGLILGLAQVAFSAEGNEICVTSYSEALKTDSRLLKNAIPIIQGKNLTNKTDSTHLQFENSDRIVVKQLSLKTFGAGELLQREGLITICDKNGVLEISSVLSPTPANIVFTDGCMKIVGLLGSIAGNSGHFCEGKIPEKVQAAIKRDNEKQSLLAAAPVRVDSLSQTPNYTRR